MCPQVALSFYYMARYTLGAEDFPSGEADDDGTWEAWRSECVFPQDKSRTTPMSYKSHLDATNQFLKDHDLQTSGKTHALRKTAVQYAEQAGVENSTHVPPDGALAAGGWQGIDGKNYNRFFHPRFIILPTPALVDHMFPFLPRLRAVVAGRKAEKKKCVSQAAVLEFIELLAVVGFQGCLDLVYTKRAFDSSNNCINPVIQYIMNHPDFKLRLQSYVAGHEQQVGAAD